MPIVILVVGQRVIDAAEVLRGFNQTAQVITLNVFKRPALLNAVLKALCRNLREQVDVGPSNRQLIGIGDKTRIHPSDCNKLANGRAARSHADLFAKLTKVISIKHLIGFENNPTHIQRCTRGPLNPDFERSYILVALALLNRLIELHAALKTECRRVLWLRCGLGFSANKVYRAGYTER